MNRDKNGRFVKASKELSVGQKIHYYQLKDGMIINFIANSNGEIPVNNAIVVKEGDTFYAVHDNPNAVGFDPVKKRFGKKFSWWLDFRWAGYDYKDMIFRGWYKPEVKKEVQSMYKIGDMVKFYGAKNEIIGIYEDRLWLKHKYIDSNTYSYNMTTIGNVSPWIGDIVKPKYQVGDLVLTKSDLTVEIIEISKDGVYYKVKGVMCGNDGCFSCFSEKDILRKIGVVTME
jgi:hypothetical protein